MCGQKESQLSIKICFEQAIQLIEELQYQT